MTAPALTQRIEVLERSSIEYDHWINGNGNPGAKVKLAEQDAKIAAICENFERLEKSIKEFTGVVLSLIGVIVTIGLPFAVWFFTSFVPSVLGHIQSHP